MITNVGKCINESKSVGIYACIKKLSREGMHRIEQK